MSYAARLPLQLIDVASHISSTLAMPDHLRDILRMLDSQAISLETIAHELEDEPTLVARLMRVANSPFYGVAGRVEGVGQALRVLGTSNTQSFVTAMITMSQLSRLSLDPETRDKLRQHSLMVAYLARNLANLTGLSQDTAFVAGLLHDFGRFVLISEFAEHYMPVLESHYITQRPITELEQQLLGFNHADVGAELARIWHYPERIEQAIRHHHAPNGQMEGIVLLIALANRLDNDDERTDDLHLASWLRLGISEAALAESATTSRQQVLALLHAEAIEPTTAVGA
ncbi:HDOD domain-containing protein [Chitinimonas naiadis]